MVPSSENRPMVDINASVNTIQARKETSETEMAQNKRANTVELPLIKASVFEIEYTCLLDSGSTHTVMNEEVFMSLKRKMPKLQVLPTCGFFCTLAVGSKQNKVRGQVLLPMKINGIIYELIFLIIPHLSVNFIIGSEDLYKWDAIVDFGRRSLTIHECNRATEIPFVTSELNNAELGTIAEQEILEGSFFVEHLMVNGKNAVVKNRDHSTVGNVLKDGAGKQLLCDD